uniref:F-box domain-containing protein n=1 Tax=Caenorhabditis tropicalis TaxID=1561998 RepID=A0A1I7UPP5_9PELO
MNLLNLPLLVFEDVFETMQFRERFLISLMSKRAKRMTQTSMPVHFVFNFTNDLLVHAGTNTQHCRSEVTEESSDHIIGGEKINGLCRILLSNSACLGVGVHEDGQSAAGLYQVVLLENWIDSDVALEYLSANHIRSIDFETMIIGLRKPGVQQRSDVVVVKRRNGSEFVISSTADRFYIMTKEEHGEHSQKHHLVNV